MILTPEVLAILILNAIFALFGMVAFVLSVKIYLNWDINSTSTAQYRLEKQSSLAATIIKYIFSIKVPLFIFFIFTLDKISNVLTGAMCAAGVVDATEQGTYLIVLKIINLYLFALWLKLNAEDVKDRNQPHTKLKFGFFALIFFLFIVEVILEWVMFSAIEIDKMVSCCGSIYSSSANSGISSIFSLGTAALLALFYGNYLLIVLFYFLKKRYLFAVTNMLFVVIAIIALILFFGTYIYELPSHHCPFCFLQRDYYYIGYLIYGMLFVGTFYGLVVGFFKESILSYKISLLFNSLYVILLSLYVVVYYLKNGVLL
ncbi:MAG: hypothetical protein A3K14_03605 [Sulfurimonas sp. RIFCSPLOWO2_12_FULL_36_74]|uniref:hypothetical protein n=1 Tax=Sulfurimonas sp. RIFCSPLOWO2_12_36_12 TaxID=1802253 RepID=UPI0008C7D39F|nr:hypothetical protein [Sulfurimonas sp. RIFCSPLOWO2_12_36_12]OHE00401.1 MAG: hypothetical protein A3J26_07010 [Sulfurimonas sp. RIFCSPLOWO2_02_FULL_36_28]OHE01487.1 MAG: hypothetical protein A2W82_02555 [Sulfurimonas sp. RIFCSPLOWO2_12_36_12]OHE03023.1 MAG: hypothetical protein A3K14_03605 [Sulfurimonas sp. RIFCSPLOWO2_12_FULL_36_74]